MDWQQARVLRCRAARLFRLAVAILAVCALVAPRGAPSVSAGPNASEARYFSQTGYRIASDLFWDYFQKRGGVRTFGYPVSREFSLSGTKVQIFQRQVMQLRPDGAVGLLNLLDPGLMPYTAINGATLPPFDPAVASAAPTPGSAGYDQAILRFVRQHAPDTWQGQPVNFWTTFANSVRLTDAFPNGGGDANLLPALALEVWGIPTSQPAFDPNNRNFVYLRFQRGVMQYDATTGLTQGVLLADYFKGVLIGDKLPSDLDKAAKNSPHYKQYSRTAYRGLNRPDALPLTDLTNAFEQEGTPTGSQQPTTPPPASGSTGGSSATTPAKSDAPVLSNSSLKVTVQIGGPEHGRLTIRAANGDLRGAAYPTVLLGNGRVISFQKDLQPDGATFQITPVGDPALGEGRQLEVEYGLKGASGRVKLTVTLLNDQPIVIAQVGASGLASDRTITGFRLFDADAGGWLDLSQNATYLTSDSDLRRDTFDVLRRTGEIMPGMPLLLNDVPRGRAFVLATLGSMDHVATFNGRATADGLTFGYELTLPPADGRQAAVSPYVYLEVAGAGDPGQVLSAFRKAINGLYPTPKLPEWARLQWTSTYAFANGATESQIRQQIDLIAANFADLGAWSIVIDGDWYRADGRADADGRTVNTTRFPNGMRALIDYAHLKGVRVILTVPGPYVDDTQQAGNVNGLRGLVTQRSAWLTDISGEQHGGRYLFNMQSQGLKDWWSALLRDIVVAYDADGIRIDGYGDALATVRQVTMRSSLQAAEFYKFTAEQLWAAKPGAYIESNFYVPAFANPYVHVVRYADEANAFDRAYPKAGLRQHIEYALFQKIATNQRPHLGDARLDTRIAGTELRWLEAAAALGAQVSISGDLSGLDDATIRDLRARLALLRPFAGKTAFSFGVSAEAFATTIDGTTYLGLLNRTGSVRTVNVKLSDIGVAGRVVGIHDATTGALLSATDAVKADLAPNAFKLYILRAQPGVIWTTSAVSNLSIEPSAIRLTVQGPSSVAGVVALTAPPPARVVVDGAPRDSGGYTYDSAAGIIRIPYGHDAKHDIRIEFSGDVSVLNWRR